MVKLSVVIITYNEEKNIARCLESVKDIADEIVVVDSFSEDRTQEICSEYDAKVLKHHFTGHIQQKNWAFSHASFHHILSIDADEEISDTLRKSIVKTKQNWNHDGYYFNRMNNYCGKWIKHGGWYPDQKLRLVDRRKGRWTGINPHDRFKLVPVSKKQKLAGNLLHYSYASIPEHLKQINRYTEIISTGYFHEGIKSNLLKIIFNPTWKFFRNYFLRLGFLDGFHGIVLYANVAFETFLKYIKLWQITNQYKKGFLDLNSLKKKREYLIENNKLLDTIPN
jgi:glycosyltransferase involved in cell wall biosynthesis